VVDKGGKERQPTPLAVAVSCVGTAAATVFLETGADQPIGEEKARVLPLHAAAKAVGMGCEALFLGRGMPLDRHAERCALYLAVENGHLAVATLLAGPGGNQSSSQSIQNNLTRPRHPVNLENAVHSGRVALLMVLLSNNSATTPVTTAVCLNSPCDPDCRIETNGKWSPAWWRCCSANLSAVSHGYHGQHFPNMTGVP